MTPKTTLNPKVVHAIKNLQVLYNNDANNIVEQVAQEKKAKDFFLMDLATFTMVANATKSTKDKQQTFNKTWNYANLESQRNWQEAS